MMRLSGSTKLCCRIRFALYAGGAILDECMETRHRALAQASLERKWTSAQASTTRSAPCSAFGKAGSLLFAAASVENGNLAGGDATSLAFAFRCATDSSRSPRLLA